jgi:hypothetical protein
MVPIVEIAVNYPVPDITVLVLKARHPLIDHGRINP